MRKRWEVVIRRQYIQEQIVLEPEINSFEGRREEANEGEKYNTELRLKWNIIVNNQKNKISEEPTMKREWEYRLYFRKKKKEQLHILKENVDDKVY